MAMDQSDDEEFVDCNDTNPDAAAESHKKNGTKNGNTHLVPSGASNASLNGMVITSRWGGRTRLPSPMLSNSDIGLWSILKQCIGKELSKITMPVVFNEPLSFLQRVVEYMEYADLIKKASDCNDPIERLEYVAAFAASAAASNWERVGKPFNPLLGETYELDRSDLGFKIVAEQVSHHPPVSAFHADSPIFNFHGAIYPKLKFWGKSIEVTPKGIVCLHLLRHNEVYTWQNVNCCVHNIIVGKVWLELTGVMEIVNEKTKMKAELNFRKAGWFGRDLHKVDGFIYSKDKQKLRAFYGKWTEALYSYDVSDWENYIKTKGKSTDSLPSMDLSVGGADGGDSDSLPADDRQSTCNMNLPSQKLLWVTNPRSPDAKQYYNFSSFAMTLNELTDELVRKPLPPTDCRLRPDMRLMEEGNLDGAADAKNIVEEKQRATRKERKRADNDWTPLWFSLGKNVHTGHDDWLFDGDYWKRDWSKCPNIF